MTPYCTLAHEEFLMKNLDCIIAFIVPLPPISIESSIEGEEGLRTRLGIYLVILK